jgi:hypothetical protein
MGTHGMALFGGREGLMASHLPMFHRPHDVQALLRIRLRDAALDLRIREQLSREPKLWTINPERFDLDRLTPGDAEPLTRFRAALFEGHFERDGQVRLEGVEIAVEAVPLFSRLSPEPRRAPQQRFLWFGLGHEQFLVKRLEQRPDIDLIGRFEVRQPWRGQKHLTLPAPSALQAPSNGLLPGKVSWLYTETGDLV